MFFDLLNSGMRQNIILVDFARDANAEYKSWLCDYEKCVHRPWNFQLSSERLKNVFCVVQKESVSEAARE